VVRQNPLRRLGVGEEGSNPAALLVRDTRIEGNGSWGTRRRRGPRAGHGWAWAGSSAAKAWSRAVPGAPW